MKHIVGIFTAAIIMLLTGCAVSVPMASIEQDAKAKEFSPTQNKASLYIYRNESIGMAIPMTVSVNGKTLGQTAAQTYFWLNVTPGKYNVQSHTENLSNLSLSLEAGRNYFVWQEVKIGMLTPKSLLQRVDDNAGHAGVTESKLIASLVPDKDFASLDTPIAAPSVSQPPSSDSVSKKLRDIQNLRKDGIITEDDFQKKKQQLLEKL